MNPSHAKTIAKVRNITAAIALDRGDHPELAALLCRDLGSDVVFAQGRFWRYVAPIYVEISASELSTRVQDYAGRPVNPKGDALKLKATDVAGIIKLAGHRLDEPRFFDDAATGIAFADCFVRVTPTGLKQEPQSREHRARAAYDFTIRKAAPVAFLRFLADVFRDDADRDEKISFVQEFGGTCLAGLAAHYGVAVVLFGESAANGKSTLLRIVQEAMPRGTTSAIAPQLWSSEYRRAQLSGVRLNAVSELPDADIADSEIFKAIVTGDAIDARPIREEPFTFRPLAGHAFASNRLPSVGDLTWGFFRRLAFLTFNRRFEVHEQDAQLADRIIATERPEIVGWLLDGAARILARGGYAVPPSSAGQVDAWRRTADSVSSFVNEECEPNGEGTKSSVLFASYREWALASGYRPVNIKNFSQRLSALGFPRLERREANFYALAVKRGAR